jgi:hypothetical protein
MINKNMTNQTFEGTIFQKDRVKKERWQLKSASGKKERMKREIVILKFKVFMRE